MRVGQEIGYFVQQMVRVLLKAECDEKTHQADLNKSCLRNDYSKATHRVLLRGYNILCVDLFGDILYP